MVSFWNKLSHGADDGFRKQWNERRRRQSADQPRFDYHPIPDEALAASDAEYSSPELRSLLIGNMIKVYQEGLIPIRALFNTGLCHAIASAGNAIPCSTLVVEDACSFKVRAMNEALAETPVDLLLLLEEASDRHPAEWPQQEEFRTELAERLSDNDRHSLWRHSTSLLVRRLHCSKADFLAFQEAAIVVIEHGLFVEDVEGNTAVSYVLQDIFTTIAERSNYILQRHTELAWRPEEDMDRVVADDLIGVSR